MTNTKRNPIHFLLAVILLGAVLSAIPMSLGIPGSKDIVAFARTRSSVTEPAGNLTASLPLSGTAGIPICLRKTSC